MVGRTAWDLMLQSDNVIHNPVQWMEAGVHGHLEAVVRAVVMEPREEPDHVPTHHQAMVGRTALDRVLQSDNVIHNPVQLMEAGVHGHLEAVVKAVVVEPREEPGHVTIHHQAMVGRTAWDLMLQTDNVIHNPVQWMEDGVPGRMKAVVRAVVMEPR